MARDLLGRSHRKAQCLTTLTASDASRLGENNTTISENVTTKQRHTKISAEVVNCTRKTYVTIAKIHEIEEQTQAYKIASAKLQTHLTRLQTELSFLRLLVMVLESEQTKGQILDNAVLDLWNGNKDGSQDPRSARLSSLALQYKPR